MATYLATLKIELERALYRAALHRHAGNISAAAREFGIDRRDFYRAMKKLDLVVVRMGKGTTARRPSTTSKGVRRQPASPSRRGSLTNPPVERTPVFGFLLETTGE